MLSLLTTAPPPPPGVVVVVEVGAGLAVHDIAASARIAGSPIEIASSTLFIIIYLPCVP
jgi:hypothetical protein